MTSTAIIIILVISGIILAGWAGSKVMKSLEDNKETGKFKLRKIGMKK